ncbi:hypothetical protein [Microbacterium esteraromaticum]|nr:hypothetical protein [Microbacterium esteraromaticum]
MTDDRINQSANGAQPQGLQTASIETAQWLSNLSYAATALEGSADNGDRYCARLIREHLAAVAAHRSEIPDPSADEKDAGLSDAHSESYRQGWRAGRASAHAEPQSEPSEEHIRLATLAAVKKGAKSDAEAVRNYREAERVIRAAIPHLGNSDECEPFDGPLPLCGYCGDRPGAPGCPAHGAPQGRPSDDDRIDAAARALNPQAWEVYDKASPGIDRDLIVDGSRAQARAALRAAGAVVNP